MIRKFAAALVALVFAVGSVFADEIKAKFVKIDGGKLTVKVEDKEKTYDISDLKLKRKGKDGAEKEFEAVKMFGKAKEGADLTLTVDGDKVKDIKMSFGKKKEDKK